MTSWRLANGTRGGANARDRQIAERERQIEKRDQVIGALTVRSIALAGRRSVWFKPIPPPAPLAFHPSNHGINQA
jgi:hypothetical protein